MAWNIQMLDDLTAKHEFSLVTPIDNEIIPRVTIVDAQRLWKRNPSILFQTGYHIAGTREDIMNSLLPQGITEHDINDLIATSITSTNYLAEMAPFYNGEVAEYNLWRRSVVKANIESPGVKLFDIMVAVNPTLLTTIKSTKQAKALGLTTGPTRGKGKGHVTSIYDKLKDLAPGKVLDVSHLTVNGAGARTIDIPTQRTRKYGVPTLRIVSADLEHYIMAVNMLPGGETEYANEVTAMTQFFTQKAKPAAMLTIPGITPLVPQMPGITPLVPQMPGIKPLVPQIPGITPLVPQMPGITPLVPQIPGIKPLIPQMPGITPLVPQMPGIKPLVPKATPFVPQIPQVPRSPGGILPFKPPQIDQLEPTRVAPLYTKQERQHQKKMQGTNAIIGQGLPPVLTPAIKLPVTTTVQTPTVPTVQFPTVPTVQFPTVPTVQFPTVPTVQFPTVPTVPTVQFPTGVRPITIPLETENGEYEDEGTEGEGTEEEFNDLEEFEDEGTEEEFEEEFEDEGTEEEFGEEFEVEVKYNIPEFTGDDENLEESEDEDEDEFINLIPTSPTKFKAPTSPTTTVQQIPRSPAVVVPQLPRSPTVVPQVPRSPVVVIPQVPRSPAVVIPQFPRSPAVVIPQFPRQ